MKKLPLSEEPDCPPQTYDAVDQQQIEQAAALFTALADPTRLAILKLLAEHQEEVCVCHITDHFDLGQSTISHHLKLLRTTQLVSTNKRGKWVYYSLSSDSAEKVCKLLQLVFAAPTLQQAYTEKTGVLSCS